MVAGVDIGGSTTKAVIVDGTTSLTSVSIPTSFASPDHMADLALSAVGAALRQTGHEVADLAAIGVGIPGEVANGQVRNAANLDIGDDGFDLGSSLTSATGLPTQVENDMTVAAFGAFTRLAESEPAIENLVYVGLGTGISAGLVLNGQIYRGSRSLAGEIGHVPMGTGSSCACGTVGCLETVMGANALSKTWGRGLAEGLFRAATDGDDAARAVVDHAIAYLATALWWLAAAYDPDCFLIGGGVAVNNPSIKTLITARWVEMSDGSAHARRVLDPDRIRISDLEEPVGAYGAALLAAGARSDRGATNPGRNWEEETSK